MTANEERERKIYISERKNGLPAKFIVARELYMHGNEVGERVLDLDKLSDKSGVDKAKLEKLTKQWDLDLVEELEGRTFFMSHKTIAASFSDTDFLRRQIDDLKRILSQGIDAIEFDEYERTMKLLVNLLNKWESNSGISAIKKAREAAMLKQAINKVDAEARPAGLPESASDPVFDV
jgi:hypothetical protein